PPCIHARPPPRAVAPRTAPDTGDLPGSPWPRRIPQQPIHPQPLPTTPGRLEIFWPTTPPIVPQRLFGTQQFGPRRVQVYVIAERLEIPRARSIHNQRLVTPAEHMPEKPVPAIESAGVNPQQPLHAFHQIGLRRFPDQQ